MRGLDLNQYPLGYEPIPNRNWSQRAYVIAFGPLWLSLRATSWVTSGSDGNGWPRRRHDGTTSVSPAVSGRGCTLSSGAAQARADLAMARSCFAAVGAARDLADAEHESVPLEN